MEMCFPYPRFPTERQSCLLHAQWLGWWSHLRVRSLHHMFGCSKRSFLIMLLLFCVCEGAIMKKCLFKMAAPSKPPPNTRMRAKATELSVNLVWLRIAPVYLRDVYRLTVEMMPVSLYTVCKYTGRYIFKGEVVFLNVTPAALMMMMMFFEGQSLTSVSVSEGQRANINCTSNLNTVEPLLSRRNGQIIFHL